MFLSSTRHTTSTLSEPHSATCSSVGSRFFSTTQRVLKWTSLLHNRAANRYASPKQKLTESRVLCFLFMKSLLLSRERRSRLPFLISSLLPTLKRRSTRVWGKPALLQTRKIAAWGARASVGLWLLSWNPEEELGCQASEVGCALPLEAALFTHLQPLELWVAGVSLFAAVSSVHAYQPL